MENWMDSRSPTEFSQSFPDHSYWLPSCMEPIGFYFSFVLLFLRGELVKLLPVIRFPLSLRYVRGLLPHGVCKG